METPTIHHFYCFFSQLLFDLCVLSLLDGIPLKLWLMVVVVEMELTPEVI